MDQKGNYYLKVVVMNNYRHLLLLFFTFLLGHQLIAQSNQTGIKSVVLEKKYVTDTVVTCKIEFSTTLKPENVDLVFLDYRGVLLQIVHLFKSQSAGENMYQGSFIGKAKTEENSISILVKAFPRGGKLKVKSNFSTDYFETYY
jgi:hypothetical protein